MRLVSVIFYQCALLFIVALAVFLLMKLSPIDPIQAYLGAGSAYISADQKAQITAAWGIDRPLLTQFMLWLTGLLSGNLGQSSAFNLPVSEVISDRIGASLALTGLAWLMSGLLGFVLGTVAAAYQGRMTDRLIRIYCYVLAATPTFWLAMLMLTVFSVRLGWTPICCAGPIGVPPDQVSWGQKLHHLALPLICLTLFGVAQIALHTRVKMIEVLSSDYVLLARAQGGRTLNIILRHGIRNAGLPALTVLMASIGEIFGGSILAEQVFAWPGLGRASVEAGLKGDVSLLLAIALLTALIVSTANLIADRLYFILDPRMQSS